MTIFVIPDQVDGTRNQAFFKLDDSVAVAIIIPSARLPRFTTSIMCVGWPSSRAMSGMSENNESGVSRRSQMMVHEYCK
jgi:hypothetical protein